MPRSKIQVHGEGVRCGAYLIQHVFTFNSAFDNKTAPLTARAPDSLQGAEPAPSTPWLRLGTHGHEWTGLNTIPPGDLAFAIGWLDSITLKVLRIRVLTRIDS